MSWNYRVVIWTYGKTEMFEIREVYYFEDGSIRAWSGAVTAYGESLEELKKDFGLQVKAFDKPVLYEVDGELKEKEDA